MTTEITTTNEIISNYFIIYPTGIDLKDPDFIPPIEAFDVLGYSLATKADELRWQAAAFCNLYKRYYPDVYEQKAHHFFVKPETIEIWAYVERNVPPENRTTEKTIYHHRVIAKVKDKQEQSQYMQHCVNNGLSVRKLEKYIADQRNEPPPASYEDQQFEATVNRHKELNELTRINSEFVIKLHEAKSRIADLESQLKQPIISPEFDDSYSLPPDSVPEVDNLARPIIGWLESVGYSALIIRRNGKIVIKP